MTTPRFLRCLAWTLDFEGGYNNIAQDRGGATNHGISLRFARSLGRVLDLNEDGVVDERDIQLITRDQAAAIYWQHFWLPVRADTLPAPIDLVTFDSAVNCGKDRATRWMQAAVGVRADGMIGPITLAAISAVAQSPRMIAAVAREVLAQRIRHHADQGPEQQRTFGLGWARRLSALGFEVGHQIAEGTTT